uniref:EF-hand domain-containing protein n=2 Tax=Lotharella globosa TaxID=91324 RepID=A0A7S4DY94_9EUKA|eukprot:CAMPEP_0167782846 /NCGR_PEP_ID=MMETSP0111_2-20121227/6749_1 /TAXON_ID=91324 /ORGANISM="Lotharella globosa, Strain CCCM811" /LENGTH=183 /DNA_ID=CAMNT_0007673733 /DNA_START=147 /DNA_END=698 /DNA_ORIENTATION=-
MTVKEFEGALLKAGVKIEKKDAELVFEGLDVDKNKELSFKEFLVYIAIGHLSQTFSSFKEVEKSKEAFEAALKLFMAFDKSSIGVVSTSEMLVLLKGIGGGEDPKGELAKSRMSELDPNGDGYVTFIEFLHAFEGWVGVDDDEADAGEETEVLEVSLARPSISTEKKKLPMHKRKSSSVHFNK